MATDQIKHPPEIFAVWESITDAFVLLDHEWRIVYANPRACRINGKPFSEFAGKTHWEEWPASAGSEVERQYRLALDSGTPVHFEHHYVDNLFDIWIDIKADPTPYGLAVYYSDITDRKRTEEQLRRSEERFRLALAHSPVIVFEQDRELRYTWVQNSYSIYASDQILGKTDCEVNPGEYSERLMALKQRVLDTGERIREEFVVPIPEKMLVYDITLEPLRDAKGEVCGIMGAAIDVTERVATVRSLRESDDRFRRLADAMAQTVWTALPDGSVDYVNQQWFDFTGLSFAETRGWGWGAVVHPDDLSRTQAYWRKMIAAGEPATFEFRARGKDGTYRWQLTRAVPTRDENGAVEKWYGATTDIDAQKQAEALLKQQAEELARSNADLQQFVYVASHDLQEPLRTMTSFAQLLSRQYTGKFDENADQWLKFISEGAYRMQEMIEDLLAYSQVRTGPTTLRRPVVMAKIVNDVERSFAIQIRETGATIRCDDLPIVKGDPAQLGQVIQNLIGNALKYHRPGVPPQVRITARQSEREWLFQVSDNGEGFSPEHSEQIFGLFKRLHGREVDGTGLGLAICKTIVERHGGRIWADGIPGQGATFSFTLPV